MHAVYHFCQQGGKLASTIFRSIPFREVVVVVILMLIFKEQYPFSNFPMYSNLGSDVIILFLTDEEGHVLPYQETFGLRSSQARKIFLRNRSKLEKAWRGSDDVLDEEESANLDSKAGIQLIDYLYQLAPSDKKNDLQKSKVRLYQIRYEFDKTGLVKEQRLLVESKLPPP